MSLITILAISFGVAIDALAVAFSCGTSMRQEKKLASAIKLGIAFGFFQILMPVLGWLAGSELKKYIEPFDHWTAFIILALIGLKMIYESINKKELCPAVDIDKPKVLLLLALATSIDALMVGVGFSILDVNIVVPVISMGIITFLMSFIGTMVGERLGFKFGKRIEILGGLVLVGIGLKILLEHVKG
jgi:manganese efflux pump family protein